jgi:hypothetical protein
MISAMPTVNPSITGSGMKRNEASSPDEAADDEDESCNKRRQ